MTNLSSDVTALHILCRANCSMSNVTESSKVDCLKILNIHLLTLPIFDLYFTKLLLTA